MFPHLQQQNDQHEQIRKQLEQLQQQLNEQETNRQRQQQQQQQQSTIKTISSARQQVPYRSTSPIPNDIPRFNNGYISD